MDDATPHPTIATPDDGHRQTGLRVLVAIIAAAGLVALAWVMVGDRPRPADAGLPKAPPPLALPSDTPEGSALATAAAKLAAGDLEAARSDFTDVVAEDQDGVAGQVGLVLSRWRATGPISVERDLGQLVREYPDSALAVLHLGLVQGVLGNDRAARESLRTAEQLGLEAADPTSLRMASLADDLLHPDAFRGAYPVLVAPGDVASADRAAVRVVLSAIQRGDREAAADAAGELQRSSDAMARLVAIGSSFDKDEPEAAADRLAAIAVEPGVPAAVRDRAQLMSTLATLWGGGDRSESCTKLQASAGAGTDAGTRRLATPIAAELCN